MKKTVQNLLVVSNQQLNKDQALLELKSDLPLEGILPGQFANILVNKSHNIFLRRPFSIYQVDYKSNTLYFLIKAIGEGTKCLSKSAAGDSISVIFPLGNGYSIPHRKSKVLLVGGGVGVAGLMILACELHKAGHQVEILLGARSADDLVELEVFSRYGLVHTTTEDGTMGTKGFVSAHPVFGKEFDSFDMVYACGPEPMMKAVARLSGLSNIACEVSLENTMACGYGVCLCCVTETTEGHKCVCTDGPVFDTKKLKWQN
jgi:dihydroorotate dehydrogenase electron transfer subunit